MNNIIVTENLYIYLRDIWGQYPLTTITKDGITTYMYKDTPYIRKLIQGYNKGYNK